LFVGHVALVRRAGELAERVDAIVERYPLYESMSAGTLARVV